MTATTSTQRPGTSLSTTFQRFGPLLVPVILVIVTLGPHLLGLRSLAPADHLFRYQPWAEVAPDDLTPTHGGPFSDNFDQVFTFRQEMVERLRNFDWPLWTTLQAGGADVASYIHTGAAAPSVLPSLVTPAWYLPGLLKAGELILCWGFLFLFLRRLQINPWVATFAGAVWALSGFQVSWVNWPHTRVSALVAGVLWAFDRVVEKAEPGRVALAAFLLAATLLEGFPAVAVIGIGSVAVLLVIRLIDAADDVRDGIRRALAAGAAALLGVALSAIVVLPFGLGLGDLELDRQVPDDFIAARALGTLLAPNALGPAEKYFGPHNFIEIVGYLGAPAMLAVAVAFAALVTRRRFDVRAVLFVVTSIGGAVMVLYAFGVEPVYDLFRGLPVMSSNAPTRVKASGLLFLSIAAGIGLDWLLRWKLSNLQRALCSAVAVAGAAAAVVYLSGFIDGAPGDRRDYVRGEITRATVVTVISAIALVALVSRVRPRISRPAAVGVLLITAMVDSLTWVVPYWPRSEPSEFYPVTEAHKFLDEVLGDDRYAALQNTFFTGTSSYYGQRAAHGHTFFRPAWKEAMLKARANARSKTFVAFDDADSVYSPVLDRLGVTYWADPQLKPRCAADTPPVQPVATSGDASATYSLTGPDVRGLLINPSVELPVDTTFTLEAATADGEVRRSEFTTHPWPAGKPLAVAVPELETVGGPMELTLTTNAPIGDDAVVSACLVDDNLTLVHASGAWIYRRDHALSRIRWASSPVVETDGERRLELLASGTLTADEVLLSAPADLVPDTGSSAVITPGDNADADHLRFTVNADGAGFLVLADPIGTGWQAFVDDEEVPLLEAEHAGSAVAVPAGEHTVAFVYTPKGQIAGVATSAVAALITCGLVALSFLRRRRNSGAGTTDAATAPVDGPDGDAADGAAPAAPATRPS